MGLLGDFAKGFVIVTVVVWIYLTIMLVYMGLDALAILSLIVLIISLSVLAFEYLRYRKEKRT